MNEVRAALQNLSTQLHEAIEYARRASYLAHRFGLSQVDQRLEDDLVPAAWCSPTPVAERSALLTCVPDRLRFPRAARAAHSPAAGGGRAMCPRAILASPRMNTCGGQYG